MVFKNGLQDIHKTIMKEKKIKRNPQIPPMNGGKGVDVSKTLFYRRIGGTVYKIRVLTSENSTDTFSDKISHIISREVLTEKADYDKIELPQMSQLPEGSSA
mgnify:CR=1 FL=1